MSTAKKALIDEEISEEEPNAAKKDSKLSWFICFNGWLTQVLIIGVLHGFGVFFVEFTKEFQSSKSEAAWIGSLTYGLSMAFGPVSSMLVNRFGNRIIMVIGGLMCSASILVASFVYSIGLMFATFSVFYGIGACLCITPIMTIAMQYFDKYMTIAVGIITAGSSFGTLIYAPMSQALIDAIGWRNTFRVYAGLCSISAICSIFIKPLSTKKKTDAQKLKQSPIRRLIQDLKLWKNRVFVVWTIGITLVMFGFYIPYVHLVSYAEDCGIPPEKGSIFVMMLGACTAVGRIVFGKIIQYGYLNRLHMHQFSMVVTGTGVMLLPLLKTFAGISAYVVCVGLVDGCYVVLLPVLTATLVGVENTVLAWGFLVGTSSLTFTAGPPLAGALYDMMGSYDLAFHLAGLPIICGALVLFLIPWAQRTSKTNNVMIVVSEYAVTEDYDFADDILNESRTFGSPDSGCNPDNGCNPDGGSSTTLTGNNFALDREVSFKVKGQKRFQTKRYKDQETSTSPPSIYVPTNINEALSMLHENAVMVANLLEKSSGEIAAARHLKKNLRASTKSRSDMIQNTSSAAIGQAPHNVISIMSVPGGITIGTFGGNMTESVSSNIISSASNNRPIEVPTSLPSSVRSKTVEDHFQVSSDICSSLQGKIYQINQLLSPHGIDVIRPTPTFDETCQFTSPFYKTCIDNLASPKSKLQQETNVQPVMFENNFVKVSATSPCYVSSQPKLQSIPEVSNLNPDSNMGVTNEYIWIPDSPNKAENAEFSENINSVSLTSNVEQKSDEETKPAQSELDVFTHLFTDDDHV